TPNLSSQVKTLLEDPDRRVRVEAVHYLCYRSAISKSMLKKFQKDADIAIQTAACSALFRRKNGSAYERLADLLETAASTSDTVALEEIAHVLRYIRVSTAHTPLYRRLLTMSLNSVQKSALESIAVTQPIDILPDLMKLSAKESLQEQLQTTLAGYGSKLLPFVTNMLEDKNSPVADKKLVLRAAAEAEGALSIDFLLRFARSADLRIRFAAIKSMNRLRQKGYLPSGNAGLMPLVEEELQSLESEIGRAHTLSVSDDCLLGWLLQERVEWGIERIFRLLGLVYDWDFIHTIYRGLESPDHERRDAALDLLENTLDPELNDRIVTLLRRFTSSDPVAPNAEGQETVVESLLGEDDPILNAATVQWLKPDELKRYLTTTDLLLRHDSVLQETISWRLQTVDKKENGLTTIQKMEALSRLDVFAESGSQELLVLANHAEQVFFERNEQIFDKGGEADAFYGLIEGQVKLSTADKVETIKPGESFGIAEILANRQRVFSAHAVQKCVCLRIAADVLREVIEESTAVSRGIMELLARRLLDRS
ncbi:MAG TPA: cyclic nucleotide-binding domain-containing protein, partial [Acidobacteriota bacterium]|nr:cyclic nucleotide-binding domain-containing protein [Acidobacteriota bacterium]